MSTNTINGVMFIIAGLTPFVVYLGLGPDGAGILSAARTEQLFAYLFFNCFYMLSFSYMFGPCCGPHV